MKAAVLVILAATFLYKIWLSLLKARSMKNPIPASVADVYDESTYQKWRSYQSENLRFGLLSGVGSFLIAVLMLALNVHALFAGLFPEGWVSQLFAVALIETLSEILLIPFSYYDTMHIEEKYGFNRTSVKTFWSDQLKEFCSA